MVSQLWWGSSKDIDWLLLACVQVWRSLVNSAWQLQSLKQMGRRKDLLQVQKTSHIISLYGNFCLYATLLFWWRYQLYLDVFATGVIYHTATATCKPRFKRLFKLLFSAHDSSMTTASLQDKLAFIKLPFWFVIYLLIPTNFCKVSRPHSGWIDAR